jgi:hypothetical protein
LGSGAAHVVPLAHWFPVLPQVQLPPEQCAPDGHALPHAPQLASSLNVGSGGPQTQYDEPPEVTHCWPAPGHALPHLPQLVASPSTPWEHLHWPPLQLSPLLHPLPHWPQSLLVAFTCDKSGQTQ